MFVHTFVTSRIQNVVLHKDCINRIVSEIYCTGDVQINVYQSVIRNGKGTMQNVNYFASLSTR